MNFIHHNGYHIKLMMAAVEHKPVMRNLMQFYLYDTSEYNGKDPDKHGVFDYPYFDHYWTTQGREEEGRLPILIQINDSLVGFAFLNNFSLTIPRTPTTRNLADIFILRKWRRKSIGKVIVKEIFDSYPGQWEVKQERENTNAQQFWRNVIHEYTNGGYREVVLQDERWDGPVQSFDNNGRL
ncbi:GNAT family N-acetyltransferase [Paenibacillus tarimensis]|uniref:GNAT family N-acetyltransferase n=1 Tax=Paenibacillus tarimensis TaxID=416012 RepID=UPI001F48AA17|nr:GNAT family N-acetyltransferase [Paenibacillus tarimensis]MCF2944759.1 acetyltransferase [Paenibacillus tarimensis]